MIKQNIPHNVAQCLGDWNIDRTGKRHHYPEKERESDMINTGRHSKKLSKEYIKGDIVHFNIVKTGWDLQCVSQS